MSWREFALKVIDASGPRHSQARRRNFVFNLLLQLRRLRYRLADMVAPSRRRARRSRLQAVHALAITSRIETVGVRGRAEITYVGVDEPRLEGRSIAIVIPSFLRGRGGAEKVAGQLADIAVEAGARIDLICRAPVAGMPCYQLNPAVTLHLVDHDDDVGLARLRKHDYELVVCFGMAHFYRRIPYVARLLNAPFVIQECSNPDFLVRQLLAYTDAHTFEEAWSLRQAVLAHARAVRLTSPSYLATVGDAARPFTYAFYNAFRLPQGAQPATRCAPKLICVGGLKNANKNGLAALDAFAQFGPANHVWRLVYYGENVYVDELRRRLRANPGLQVIDAGITNDTVEMYGDAAALVIPSYQEGLPNVVVEALSFGVPCIGYADCAAVANLIEDGVNGILVDRRDPKALADAFARIAEPATRSALSAGAHAFAARNFDFDTWRRNWLNLLSRALNGKDRDSCCRAPAAESDPLPDARRWRELLETYRAVA